MQILSLAKKVGVFLGKQKKIANLVQDRTHIAYACLINIYWSMYADTFH